MNLVSLLQSFADAQGDLSGGALFRGSAAGRGSALTLIVVVSHRAASLYLHGLSRACWRSHDAIDPA